MNKKEIIEMDTELNNHPAITKFIRLFKNKDIENQQRFQYIEIVQLIIEITTIFLSIAIVLIGVKNMQIVDELNNVKLRTEQLEQTYNTCTNTTDTTDNRNY